MDFIFEAWLGLIHQPYGWVGALGATVCVIAVTIYWGIWWQRHRDYFTPNGPSGWLVTGPDSFAMFAIGMVALALIFILAALGVGLFHH